MKKGLKVLLFISAIFLLDFISAAISDDMHLNVQVRDSSGTIQTGTFAFGFNISTASDCNTDSVVFANATTQATDARGIVSYYLDDVSLNFTDQYYLCYYRDGTLKSASQMARVPYAFNSKFLNGYQSGAFFPFNTSVTGDFDFNGGWEAGGITIQGGKIYADTGFFYNLSKLNLAPSTSILLAAIITGLVFFLNSLANLNNSSLLHVVGLWLKFKLLIDS